MTRWLDDLRYALRTLLSSPGFSVLVVVTLALGIGANTAIFGLVDAVLFRPLAAQHPEELVRIGSTHEKGSGFFNSSYPVFTDYRDQARSFSGVAMFADENAIHIASGDHKARRVNGAIVSGSFFDLLGVRPAAGRLLGAGDDRAPGAHPVVVLSERLWRAEFGGRADAIGSPLRVNGVPFTIIGVAPASFLGIRIESTPDLWLPAAMSAAAMPNFADMNILESRNFSWLDMIARLKPGVTAAQAQAELDALATTRAAAQTKNPDPYARVLPASEAFIDPDHRAEMQLLSWLLLGVVGLVLLISCAVAAGLLLARSERRQREMAIRLAVGASRLDVIRSFLAESLLLSVAAAIAGVLLAAWLTDALAGTAPAGAELPFEAASPLAGPRVLLYTLGLALACTCAFGFLPAWRASRRDPLPGLKGDARADGPRVRGLSMRNALVVAQVALSGVVLIGAGLLLRSLWNANRVDLGFQTENAVIASLDVSRHGYTKEKGGPLFARLLEGAKRIPGVRSAAFARSVPVQRAGMRTTTRPEGYVFASGEEESVELNIVSPGFFQTLGIPVKRGRDFQPSDRAESQPVVIVNEAYAARYWPGQEALGKLVGDLGPDQGSVVVGVVADVRTRNVRETPGPVVYVPQTQFYMPAMTLVVRTDGKTNDVARAIGALVEAEDKDLPTYNVQTLEEHLRVSLSLERIIAGLLGFFGTLALVLTAGGLFGVVSYITEVRTREFGIRMALGAQRTDVSLMVVRQGLTLALAGTALGLAASWYLTRVLSGLVFEVGTHDAATFLWIAALLPAVAALACLLPARRATRVDPMIALRAE